MSTIRSMLVIGILGSLSVPAVAQFGDSAQEQAQRQAALEEMRRRREQKRRQTQLMFPMNTAPRDAPLPFHLGYRAGLQQLFPRYEGLPTYPNNVPGYGGYPGAAKAAGKGVGPAKVAVPGVRPETPKDRWPSWIEGGTGKKGLKVKSTEGVLVRITDRVRMRDAGERAFVPLEFHDRFRFLGVGGRVEVRGKGEYQMVLHNGGSIRSRGPCSLLIAALDDTHADLQFDKAENVWLTAGARPLRVRLPDGTQLEFTAGRVQLQRRGDRIRVANDGRNPIRYAGSAGTGEIVGPRFISIWVAPPSAPPHSHPLQLTGRVSQSKSGSITTIRGGDDGRVAWSGASFALGEGASLQIQALSAVSR